MGEASDRIKGELTKKRKKGRGKVAKVMGEFKKGELHSGSAKGPAVTSRSQAIAIALSESRKEKAAKA